MKKTISILLVLVLIMGVVPANVVMAANSKTTLGYSAQNTAFSKGIATVNVNKPLHVNDTFTITFDRNSFVWSPTGDGSYNGGKRTTNWVTMTGAVPGVDFTVLSTTVDTVSGSGVVTLKALKAYEGTLSVTLNGGAGASAAASKQLSVVQPVDSILKTKVGGTAPFSSSHTGTQKINAGEKILFRVPADNFEWSGNSIVKQPNSISDTSWVSLSGATKGRDFSVDFFPIQDSTGDIGVELTAERTGSYPNLQISLLGGGGSVTTSSVSLNITVVENSTGKITGIATDAQLGGKHSGSILNGTPVTHLSALTVRAGDELLIPLTSGFFTWDGQAPYVNSPVTTAQLSMGKIKVVSASKRGSQVFTSKSPEIVNRNGQAFIAIKFDKIKKGTSTTDTDFSMTAYLTVGGSRHSSSLLDLAGTLIVDVYTASESGFYDISDGSVLEADEFIRNVEIYLGSGVTLYGNLYSGKRYTASANNEITSADEEMLRKYPSIQEVVSLKTSGFNKSGYKISLDNYGELYYVYNGAGEYIGRSNEKLHYGNKYYLSTEKITIKEEVSEDFSGLNVNESLLPFESEFINESPKNTNDNPSTGG